MFLSSFPPSLPPSLPPRYLKVELGDYDLVVRSEVDAAIKVGDATQLLAIHALNEFDPKVGRLGAGGVAARSRVG